MAPSGTVVVTDSAAALPSVLQSKYGIVVIPLLLEIDGSIYTEGINISPPRVVAALLGGARVRVLEPPADEIGRVYRSLAADGADYIVSVHVSGAIHSIVEYALEAAGHTTIPVDVIDTRTIGMGQGFATLAAGAQVIAGHGAAAASAAARETAKSSKVLMTVETLEYAHRDGQVPGAIRALSDTLRMRPMLELKDGKIVRTGGTRNTEPARLEVKRRMEEYVSTLARPIVSIALVGGGAVEAGLAISTPGPMMEVSPGASLSAHAGPGTYIVAAADMPADAPIEF
jgi:DegV family protein with EDD domain